jgi:hypothetical protein
VSEQSEMAHKVSEQVELDIAWVKGNLSRIESQTEVDEKGRPAVHSAGYYLARIERDTTALKLQVAALSGGAAVPAQPSAHKPGDSAAESAVESAASPSAVPAAAATTVRKTAKTYVRDLIERVLSTFVQGFIGGIAITQPLNGSMWYAALAGGVGAVLALIKGLIARGWGTGNSASLFGGV